MINELEQDETEYDPDHPFYYKGNNMIEVHYPINGFQNAHEVIAEAQRTGIPICDLIGKGLPAEWSQDQLIAAHLRGECSEGYLAVRLKVDNLTVKERIGEKISYNIFLEREMKGQP